ncbi:hypothetical protein [Arthrobacter sp. yr096]|uniref:hypothetical protein n=1 Tax=Arthrobacter sp. yr096 TaxID=1761750 RepID=UPI000B860828|nr:hypothetical protein [Arthrobacter sp. yr096]
MRERFIDTKANVVTNYRDLDTFLGAEDVPPGILSIAHNNLPIDLVNSNIGANTTVIILHGAIEAHHKIPFLSGGGITAGLQANRISISDPSLILSDKLQLSWFAGNKHQRVQSVLPRIIDKVLQSHGSERVIFFGGSGGGFASLYFASLFPGSLAFIWNPQTDITKYHGRNVRDWATLAYGISEDEYDPISRIPDMPVTDLREIYSRRVGSTVLYLQNLNDEYHIERHLKPFLEVQHPDNKIHVFQAAWREGHTPPPKDDLRSGLEQLVGPESWDVVIPRLAAGQFVSLDA